MSEENELFQDLRVKEVLTSRAKTKDNTTCVSGEDVNGVHYKYTREYFRWNLKGLWVKVAHAFTEEEREQWFIDNPPPSNKFQENL